MRKNSVLIRFTHSQYIDSYLTGDLYLSSLSSFWDLKRNKIPYHKAATATAAELAKAANDKQQDFAEGVSVLIPRDKAMLLFLEDFKDHIIHDVRFQIAAYGYCNLLCFYRVDTQEISGTDTVDDRYLSQIKKSLLLNPACCHVVQNPPDSMFEFGDAVVIIKDEDEFIDRVMAAVLKQKGHCIMGDVRYHRMVDRLDASTMNRHHITLKSDQPFIDLADVVRVAGDSGMIHYGCLDKYDRYREQKEWRVCWLPEEHNFSPKLLHVGSLEDIIEIVPASEIRERLLNLFPGYYLGETDVTKKTCRGTVSYRDFKQMVEGIDGKCRPIIELG